MTQKTFAAPSDIRDIRTLVGPHENVLLVLVTVELGHHCQEMTCQLQINIVLNKLFELFLDMVTIDPAMERWLLPSPSRVDRKATL